MYRAYMAKPNRDRAKRIWKIISSIIHKQKSWQKNSIARSRT